MRLCLVKLTAANIFLLHSCLLRLKEQITHFLTNLTMSKCSVISLLFRLTIRKRLRELKTLSCLYTAAFNWYHCVMKLVSLWGQTELLRPLKKSGPQPWYAWAHQSISVPRHLINQILNYMYTTNPGMLNVKCVNYNTAVKEKKIRTIMYWQIMVMW